MESLKITVVMVTYNRSKVVSEAIDCLQKQTYPIENIIIIDNCSTDDTLEVLSKRKSADPRIQFRMRSENGGYAAGLETGILWGLSDFETDYFWMMDDDSYPVPDALELLVKGISSYKYDMLGLSGFKMTTTTKVTIEPQEEVQTVDYILIDNALVRKGVAEKVGAPNPDFFMMCEDYEYCLRIKKAGFKIGVMKNNHVNRLHLGSQKFSNATLWRGYYHSRNHMIILRQYFSCNMMIHYVLMQLKYLFGSFSAPDRFTRIKFRLIGIYHGLIGKKGKTLRPDTLKFQ
jgi:GT2 family glycosyltransferase